MIYYYFARFKEKVISPTGSGGTSVHKIDSIPGKIEIYRDEVNDPNTLTVKTYTGRVYDYSWSTVSAASRMPSAEPKKVKKTTETE